ncbi:MAG: O-antigen ligase family protein [Anaerolineales bacterium]|nr:O-antigen ligase family protein [Anaerolineales bacterium]
MKRKPPLRSWKDFFRTSFVLVWLILLNFCWQSTNPHFRLTGLILPVLTGLIWLFHALRKSERIYIPRFLIPLTLLLPLQVFLSLRAIIPAASMRFVPYTFVILFGFLLIHNLLKTGWNSVVFEDALISLGLIYSAIEILLVILWYRSWWTISEFPSIPPEGYRASGLLLGHPNLFAVFINMLLPLVVVRIFKTGGRSHRLLWASVLILFLASDYYTSSRGGWIGAAAALSFTTVFYIIPPILKKQESIKEELGRFISMRRIPLLLGTVGIMGALLFLLNRQAQRTSHRPLFSSRGYIWRPAWNAIQQSPFWGHGSGSFPLLYISDSAPPPAWISGHAHNLVLQIWLEFGIPGLLLVLSAGVLLLTALLRIGRSSEKALPVLAAVGGALGGILTHHLFDYALENPFLPFLILIICSLPFIFERPQQAYSVHNLAVLSPALVISMTLALVFFKPFQAKFEYWNGIDYAQARDWDSARSSFCAAQEIYPDLPFYAFQCSLAEAYNLEDQEKPDYSPAIELLTYALSGDPTWPVHTVNLAYLYWEGMDRTEAIHLMQQAVRIAPDMAGFHLNLGWMLEESGLETSAAEAYQNALLTDPELIFSVFMQNSTLRIGTTRKVADLLLSDSGNGFNSNSEKLEWMGSYYLASEDSVRAQACFETVLHENSTNTDAMIGLAEVYYRTGRSEQAQDLIDTALFLSKNIPEAYLTHGRILRAIQQNAEAVQSFDTAFDLLTSKSFSLEYYYNVYGEYAPQVDLVPEYNHGNLTLEGLEDLRWLAEYHLSRGSSDLAEQITRYIDNESNR